MRTANLLDLSVSPSPQIRNTFLTLALALFANCYSYPPDSMQFLDSRLNGFNATLVVAQHELLIVKSEMRTFTSSFQSDLSNALGQLSGIHAKLEKSWKAVEELQEQVAGLVTSVAAVEGGVQELTEKVTTLEGYNQLWKQNFQVVNRTFTALRKSGCLKF